MRTSMVIRRPYPLALVAILAFVLLAPAAYARTSITILTDDAYPPYSYLENHKAVGIYPDILRAAAKIIPDYQVTLVPTPWRRAMAELEAGTALAAAPPYYRPTERPYIGTYSEPMLEERVVVYCGKSVFANNPRLRWPDDYRGLVFGNNFGFLLGGQGFWSAVQMGLIRVEEAPGSRTNLLKLVNGHVDCYMNDRLSIQIELAKMQREGVITENQQGKIEEGPTLSLENGFVGFTNRDNGKFAYKDDFIQKLNAALLKLRQNGAIRRIVNQYLGQ